MMEEKTIVMGGGGIGLTAAQLEVLSAVVAHVSLHGALPSRRDLARLLGCNISNAARAIQRLMERGQLSSDTPGGPLTGFGDGAGVKVTLPAETAARLAAFCYARRERMQAVLADAVMLHLDALSLVEDDGGEVTDDA